MKKENQTIVFTQELNELAKPLLDKTPISYFGYTWIDNHGFGNKIDTNGCFSQHILNTDSYVNEQDIFYTPSQQLCLASSLTEKLKKDRSNCSRLIQESSQHFDLDHFLLHGIRDQHGFSGFEFAADSQQQDVISFYIENFNIIKAFIDNFIPSAKSLIKRAKQSCDNNYYEKFDLGKQAKRPTDILPLTLRESQCTVRYIQGWSAKEIANQHQLSPRTVETHIRNAKNKLNCRTRSELRAVFNHKLPGLALV